MITDQCVYFHLNPLNGKVFYIGMGKLERAKDFWNRNVNWREIVKVFGKPDVLIVAKNLTLKEASDLEKFWISYYGVDNLANVSLGGAVNGVLVSEKTRMKISAAMKGRKGRKHTEEFKRKMSERFLGEKNPQFGKKTPIEVSKKLSEALSGKKNPRYDHTIYQFFHSQHGFISCQRDELCSKYRIDRSSMVKLLKGKYKSVEGWKLVA